MQISISELKAIVSEIILKTGIPTEEGNKIIDHIIYAEIMGKKTHGVYRLPYIVNKLKNINYAQVEIIPINNSFIKIDGKGQYALAVCEHVVEAAIQNTLTNPITFVCGTNYVGNTGVMGYYSRKLAERNLISIIFCNSEYAIAPTGGCEAILGTNPIAFGFPNEEHPIIVDFATAAKTYGELMIMAKTHKKVEYGVVLDSEGNPSHDPYDAENGCQLPMAGAKGYGLSLAIEILAGLFAGGKAGKEAVMGSDGFTVIAFKPDQFISTELYKSRLTSLISEIKNSKLAQGYSEILIPGEKSMKNYFANLESGYVQIEDEIFDALSELR